MSNQELLRAPGLEWALLFRSARKQCSLLRPGFQTKGVQTETGAASGVLNSVLPLCSLSPGTSTVSCPSHLQGLTASAIGFDCHDVQTGHCWRSWTNELDFTHQSDLTVTVIHTPWNSLYSNSKQFTCWLEKNKNIFNYIVFIPYFIHYY